MLTSSGLSRILDILYWYRNQREIRKYNGSFAYLEILRSRERALEQQGAGLAGIDADPVYRRQQIDHSRGDIHALSTCTADTGMPIEACAASSVLHLLE